MGAGDNTDGAFDWANCTVRVLIMSLDWPSAHLWRRVFTAMPPPSFTAMPLQPSPATPSPPSAAVGAAEARRVRLGLWLGALGVLIFATTIPMTRLACGSQEAPRLDPVFVALG